MKRHPGQLTQSVGYLTGAIGSVLVGWVNDTTHKFGFAISGMILITLIIAMVQWLIVPWKAKSAVETAARIMKHI